MAVPTLPIKAGTGQFMGDPYVQRHFKDTRGYGAESAPVRLDTYTAHLTGKHLYMLDGGLTEDDMVALTDLYLGRADFNPENVVLFGYSFAFTETEMLRKNLMTLSDSVKNLRVNIDIRY